jgi:hypothetical protein
VVFGADFLKLCRRHSAANEVDVPQRFAAWDGRWYVGIVQHGYSYDPKERSNVAFFPAFPLLARGVAAITGMSAECALLAVAHLSLVGCFVVLAAYVGGMADRPISLTDWTLLAFGLAPHTFYFRMAYSESLFLLAVLLTMYGVQRNWPLAAIAATIGFATACRSAALALSAPFALHLWQASRTRWVFLRNAIVLSPIALWGLLAYMAYQHCEVGDALAFVKTSALWNHRSPSPDVWHGIRGLLTLEPFRAVYTPSSPCFWSDKPPVGNALFNLFFAHPIYFAATAGLLALGYRKRWLDAKEGLLGAGLLLIPYVTHAERCCMAGETRYASVVFPVYIVLGQLLVRMPPPLAALCSAWSACLMAAYSALFVSWYWFY